MKIYLTIEPEEEDFETFETECYSIENLEMELGRFERHIYNPKSL
jgi:hypothetical protein